MTFVIRHEEQLFAAGSHDPPAVSACGSSAYGETGVASNITVPPGLEWVRSAAANCSSDPRARSLNLAVNSHLAADALRLQGPEPASKIRASSTCCVLRAIPANPPAF